MSLITTKQVRTVDFLRLLSVLTKPKLQTMLQLPVDEWENAGVYLGWENKFFIESDLQRPQLEQSQMQLSSDYYGGTTYYIRENSYSGHPSESVNVKIMAADYNPPSNVIRQCLYPTNTYITVEFYDDNGLSIKTSETNPILFSWCYILEDGSTRFGAPFTAIDSFKWVSSSGVSYSLANVLNVWTRYNTNTSFKVNFNTKVFYNRASAEDYINTGSTDGELAPSEEVSEDRTTILYMKAQEHKSEFSQRVPSEKIGNLRNIEFYVRSTKDTGEKIKYIERAVWGFVHNDIQPQTHNIWSDVSGVTTGRAFSTNNPESSTSNGYRCIYNNVVVCNVSTITLVCESSSIPQCDFYWYSNGVYTGSHSGYYGIGSTVNVPSGVDGFKIEFKRSDGARNPISVMDGLKLISKIEGNATTYRNITFVKNPNFEVYKILENGVDVTNSFDWSSRWTVWENNNLFEGFYYWSNIDTNMYIFESYQKGLDAINTGIINGLLKDSFNIGGTIETPLSDNIINYDCGMSETWILSEEQSKKLAKQFNMELNDNNTNIVGDVIIGLSMYQNPIDVIVDFFNIPIDISDFYEYEEDSFRFGININEIIPNEGI